MRAISSVRRGSKRNRPAGPHCVCGYYTINVQNKSGKGNFAYRKIGLISSLAASRGPSRSRTQIRSEALSVLSAACRSRALDNVFYERLRGSVMYENINLNRYDTVRQLDAGLSAYFDFYNHVRLHQSINFGTPAE